MRLCLIVLAAWLFAPGGLRAEPPPLVTVPAGSFVAGSDHAEREAAYRLDEAAYGHDRTRRARWYDSERRRSVLALPGFEIMRDPVTNRDYAEFVQATGGPAPAIDRADWEGQKLIHPFSRALRHQWRENRYPDGRKDHPVVLVTWFEARDYAKWLSQRTGRIWRLPSELEWEKAARGTDGRRFPWGERWDPRRLNSHDRGPFDTQPVGAHPSGASPFGMRDAAGQVFEWTATEAGAGRVLVKGGSWDDKGCGVCRPAARHARPKSLRHILIGFRLVRDP